MSENSNFSVGVDFSGVLETIASHIYDNHFAFLRENLQNAIDAVRIQASRDGRPVDSGYRIDICIDDNRCEIRDTGNGMTKEQLRQNFWTMGASGKHTEEAKRAGCIGTFGIGGFANFGVCDRLTVISRTANCLVTHETSLGKDEFSTIKGQLPTVKYKETNRLGSNSTIVIGVAPVNFNKQHLLDYIRVRTHYSHQMTAAARAIAAMKFLILRSKRVAIRRQSLRRQNMRSMMLRCL